MTEQQTEDAVDMLDEITARLESRVRRLERDVLALQITAACWFVLVVWMALR